MGEYTDLPAARDPQPGARLPGRRVDRRRCPAAGTAGSGGFTYGDYGKVNGVPEVHGDGEIWAQTLWDLRRAIGSTDARRADHRGHAARRRPSRRFLDMRNAILQADGRWGRAGATQIWTVFAARGMGFFASTISSTDATPARGLLAAAARAGRAGGSTAG